MEEFQRTEKTDDSGISNILCILLIIHILTVGELFAVDALFALTILPLLLPCVNLRTKRKQASDDEVGFRPSKIEQVNGFILRVQVRLIRNFYFCLRNLLTYMHFRKLMIYNRKYNAEETSTKDITLLNSQYQSLLAL